MRKTFGRKVVETAGENSEFALIKLSELFNHADIQTTRRYLGLRTEELLETYDMLSFKSVFLKSKSDIKIKSQFVSPIE